MAAFDDIAIFAAIIQQGGFSHAARQLGLSNGLISRRITQLESELGVTLIKRSTRQFKLTPEGEVLWQHAQRIQQEYDSALELIHSSAKKPKGTIRISAPLFYGRQHLTPIIIKFLNKYPDIRIDLDLSNQAHDPIKEKLDLVIRGAGFFNEEVLKNSNLRMKLLEKNKIGLYASPAYLQKYGEPKKVEQLLKHRIVSYWGTINQSEHEKWKYTYKNKNHEIVLIPNFRCTDIESSLTACIAGYGIGKYINFVTRNAVEQQKLVPVLSEYNWGYHSLYALYSNQQVLPQRTRLLLEFIYAHTKNFSLE